MSMNMNELMKQAQQMQANMKKAQAELATAQNNLVESLFQYNVSKLALARACGVLEQQYRVYLGR